MHRSLWLVCVVLLAAACGREGRPASRLAEERTEPPSTPAPTLEVVETPAPEPTSEPTPEVTAPAATPEPAAVGWSRQDEETFSFELPDDAKDQKMQGIDSQVGRFQSDSLTVDYDYGWYSSDHGDEDAPEYRDAWMRIDGRLAHVSYWRSPGASGDEDEPTKAYEFQGGAYFPKVHESEDDSGQTTKLSLYVYSHDGWEAAERIVKSIRFKD